MELRTILAPVDFSPKSGPAVEHAAALARRFDSQLLLAHVLAPTPHEYRDFSPTGLAATHDIERMQWAQAREQLESIARQTSLPAEVEYIVVDGDPAAHIVQLASEREADLVVMPTHGRGRFRRMLVGSVTGKVLHDVTCPVLTGAHIEEQVEFRPIPYQRVACAVGLRPAGHSEMVLHWASAFARALGAPLEVIHVSPELELQGDEWLPNEMVHLLEKGAGEELQRLVDEAGVKCNIHYQGVRVREYVPKVIEKTKSEVLVVGRSAPDGLLGFANANAFELIRRAPCPVISV